MAEMTAEPDLLPLPRYPADGAEDEYSYNTGWNDCLAECRANVAELQREVEALRKERDFLVEEYERAVACGPQGYTHAATHLFNAIANAQADQNAKFIMALRAEVERLKRIEFCWGEWLEKTEWVQQTIKPRELGRHRADILRERIQRSEANTERLAEALRDLLNVSDKFTGDPEEDAATWVAANDAARAALEQENDDA